MSDYYVSLAGDDDYPGSREMPFCSLVRTQSAVRHLSDEKEWRRA